MQAVMETLFDVVYLVTVISLGIAMVRKAQGNQQDKLFGIMAIVLGCGDAFHLVPRAYALCTTGLENHVAALGFGKFITSVTMTIFYVILYQIWKLRYEVKKTRYLDLFTYLLAFIRILLCLFPQNRWIYEDAPLNWGIYRNIPFAILGFLIIMLFYQKSREKEDKGFRFMWLAVTLSFCFYIPVVLWADVYPLVGMLMIPKTCAYVWIVYMGFREVLHKG